MDKEWDDYKLIADAEDDEDDMGDQKEYKFKNKNLLVAKQSRASQQQFDKKRHSNPRKGDIPSPGQVPPPKHRSPAIVKVEHHSMDQESGKAYKQLIVKCEDDEDLDSILDDQKVYTGNRENLPMAKQPRTSKQQFEKMNLFTINMETFSKPRSKLDALWDTLANELNDIGPPVHSAQKWRRIWSVYKYDKKRFSNPRKDDIPSSDEVPPSKRRFSAIVEKPSTSCPIHDQILAKLDTILDNQQEIKHLLKSIHAKI